MEEGETSLIFTQLLWSVLLPTGVVVFWMLGLRFPPGIKLAKKSWPSAAALFLGISITYLGIVGLVFPPRESLHWIPFLLLAAFFFFALDEIYRFSPTVRAILKFIALAILLYPILSPLHQRYEGLQVVLWAGSLSTATLLIWHLYDRATLFTTGPRIVISLLATTAGSAITHLCSGSIKLAVLHGGLGCALAVCLAFQLWKQIPSFGRNSIPVAYLTLLALLGNGYFFAEVPWGSAVLLLLAHASIWLHESEWLRKKQGLSGLGLAALAPSTCAFAAAALAVWINGLPQ